MKISLAESLRNLINNLKIEGTEINIKLSKLFIFVDKFKIDLI